MLPVTARLTDDVAAFEEDFAAQRMMATMLKVSISSPRREAGNDAAQGAVMSVAVAHKSELFRFDLQMR